jgi:sortase B
VIGLKVVTRLLCGIEGIVNIVIAICLSVVFLYGAFGLWDTWQIYNSAGLDDDLLKYKPQLSADGTNPSLVDLQKINPDVCAWLTVDGTNIDYPVVQGESNLEYVNKDIYGEFSLTGSVFLDCRNHRDFSDFYSLLYAHHMEGNVMFGELPNFLEEDYFKEHTSGTLYLPECTYTIEWFSCIDGNAYTEEVFGFTQADSKKYQEQILDYLKSSSTQYRDIGVTTSDKIIGLATCSGTATDGRVILFGLMSKL